MNIKITETVLRDANQSLMATRMTEEDFDAILETMDQAGYDAIECWGGATFDLSAVSQRRPLGAFENHSFQSKEYQAVHVVSRTEPAGISSLFRRYRTSLREEIRGKRH